MTDGRMGSLKSKFIYPDVDQWVASALKTVQASNGGHSAGCLSHEFLVWLQVNLSKLSAFIYRRNKKSNKN